MFVKTEIWTIKDFLNGNKATRIEGIDLFSRQNLTTVSQIAQIMAIFYITPEVLNFCHTALAADSNSIDILNKRHPVSSAFDRKIWPLLLDIGQPLAKTMMAIGIYKCIRNDVDRGWKMVWRSGIGLMGLFLIDGAIHIISGVGQDLSNS